ncbi:MAG: hypothetical protein ABIZ81_18765 [Opitutaceae bacterium]
MKDNEFIELLNLYLDHEISQPDAARLEAEVQRHPGRYRVYREYCQMHKACALLSPSHAGEAPAAATFDAPPRSWTNPFVLGGLMAAAACAAFIFLNRAPTLLPGSTGPTISDTASLPAHSSVKQPATTQSARNIGQTVTVAISPVRSDYRPTLATQTLRWNANELSSAPIMSDARFNWIETIQLTSVPQVPADSLRFETKTIQKETPRSFSSGLPEGPTEYNAIQFQR